MIITKCAKRLMATVMTTAIVLTGFAVAPKEVKAAEENPTVEVLGATLRLHNNAENCQSMRVGILVKNASKAKSCGIKLSIGDKAVVVSTENEKYRNIYDYDKDNDVVTYTAVIKDIPQDKFSTDINIQGNLKTTGTETEINSGEQVEKNINGIVEQLNKIDSTIKINNKGILVRLVDGSEVPIESNDAILGLSPSKETTSANLNLSEFNPMGDKLTKNEDGSISVEFTANYRGANIVVPSILKNLKYVEISVVSSKNGEELNGGNQIVLRDTEGKEILTKYGKGVISSIVPEDRTLGSIVLNAQEAKENESQTMKINYIKLSKVVSLDLKNFKPQGAEDSHFNEDGSLEIKYINNYTGSYIEIPSQYQDYKYFELKVKSPNKEEEQSGTQVVFVGSDGKEIVTNYVGKWNKEGIVSFNLPEGKKLKKLIVNTQSAEASNPVNQTIYYIKAIKG
mgnify:CR=1 FL=1